MVPARDVDPAFLYETERLAFAAFLGSLADRELATSVPATPDWAVRDVLAHVVGITADLNAQRFGDGDGDAWTAAQVESRRSASVAQMAAEWDREAPTFEAGLRLFGYGFGAHYLGDLLQHVFDVHTALDRPPAIEDLHLAVALDFYLESFDETLVAERLGAVEVRVGKGEESWHLGGGEIVATVTASRFELFRSLGGRRTLDEIRGMQWSGDVGAVADLVSRYPVPIEPVGP